MRMNTWCTSKINVCGQYAFAAIVALLSILPALGFAQQISGAGATLPQRAYVQWGAAYATQSGVMLRYAGIGSGGGLQAIRDRKADFGATDTPLSEAELTRTGLRQFPTLLSAIVPVVNLPGISSNQLKLDGTTLAQLFTGKITRWNAPEVAKLNPGVRLPALAVSVIYRSDRSGSTALLSGYLANVSADWKIDMGQGQQLRWPVGLGAQGSSGVAEALSKTPGAIAYLDYAEASDRKLHTVSLLNQFNMVVTANRDSIMTATKFAEWRKHQFDTDPTFDVNLINQPGNRAWPIVAATFILLPKQNASATRNREVLKFFEWALTAGDEQLTQLGYYPLPEDVKTLVRSSWRRHFGPA